MRTRIVLAAALLAAFSGGSWGATPATATISWALPTTCTKSDNSPCTMTAADLKKIQVFVSSAPIPDTFVGPPAVEVPQSGPVPTSYVYTGNVGDKIYVRLKACIDACSKTFSNEASTTLPDPRVPGAPTSAAITISLP